MHLVDAAHAREEAATASRLGPRTRRREDSASLSGSGATAGAHLQRVRSPRDVVAAGSPVDTLSRAMTSSAGCEQSGRSARGRAVGSPWRGHGQARSHRPQPRPRRRLHVLRAHRGQGEDPGRRDRARAGGHRVAQPPRAHRRARGHRGVGRDLHAGRRAVPDDGSRRLDGEGLRADPGRAGARSPRPSSSSAWSRSRAATPPPRCSCASTSAIRRSSRSPSTRSRRPCWRGRPISGLLIHEGQITHQQMGLTKVLDLGEAWQQETGLPLPLGVNVMRRDLGERPAPRALPGAARLDRLGLRQRRRGARVRDALRARDRQGDLPPLRPDVRQRLHAARWATRAAPRSTRLYRDGARARA